MPSAPINDHFQDLLAAGISLGNEVGAEETLYDGGSMQAYDFGRIYFHPRIGQAFESHGLILQTYVDDLFAEQGPLGYPTSDEEDDPTVSGGRINTFESGTIQFDPATGIAVTKDSAPVELVPRVVVKLEDGLNVPLGDFEITDIVNLGNLLGPLALTPVFTQLEQLLGNAPIRRVFDSLPAADLQALIDAGMQNDPTYNPPDLFSFLEIDVPDGVDPDGLVNLLLTWVGIVDDAFVSAEPSDPVTGTGNPLFTKQGFLAASWGVDAPAAWARGADGSTIRLVDIEKGWFLGHEDLQPHQIQLLAGANQPISHGHGTAVLGTIMARENALGGVGIAPGVQADIMSWATTPQGPSSRQEVAKRIAKATNVLSAGDVILLEIQFPGPSGGPTRAPVEIQADIFHAIQLATANRIVVVEAAGNGSGDLDNLTVKGKQILNRTSSEFQGESGAIMVAACNSKIPHGAHPSSNFGTRIDCNAWGDHMVVPGDVLDTVPVDNPSKYHLPPSPDVGDVPFGHTSGASAVIAAVCVLVQHLRAFLTPANGSTGRLDSAGMRAVLSNPNNGIQLTADKIGPMPSLSSIISNEFL